MFALVARPLVLLAVLLALSACGGSGDEAASPAQEPATTGEPETTTAAETTTEEAATTTEEAAPPPRPKPLPGLPRYTAGYAEWPRLTDDPLPPRDADPHLGTKIVYTSRPARNGRFPNGTVVVKEARRPDADFVGLVAVMRKVRGADPEHNDWVFIEWTRDDPAGAFSEQARDAVCWSCHVGAADRDYVFTAG